MTTAVGSAAGSSVVVGIGYTGYQIGWTQLRIPISVGYQVGWVHITYASTGYQVAWARLQVPYVVTLVVSGGGEGGKAARAKRPIVDDRNDLQDLCEIWELMMRKAA
jgi:hypothetical protein